MNRSDQNAIITALERAMISQIKEYRAEEHKWLLEYGNIQPEYEVANNIVAGGSFAMVYHELLPAFNDIDVFVIDKAFSQAFIKSDADRARMAERGKCLYYDWYVDPDTFKVHSCYSGCADESFSKMVPVDFGAGGELTWYKRGVRPKNVFDIDELYCQYAMLNKEFPDNAKYAERMASTLNALCARFATNVDSSTFETYSDMDTCKITPSRKYSYGG